MEGSSSNGYDGASSSDVGRFVSLTNAPEEQAAFFLEATNGDFDRAIEMYYGERPHLFLSVVGPTAHFLYTLHSASAVGPESSQKKMCCWCPFITAKHFLAEVH